MNNYNDLDYFTPEELEEIDAIADEMRKTNYLIKELILTDIELLTL